MINPVFPLVMREPLVAFLVLNLLQWKLPLSQAGVAICVPCFPTRRPAASGFTEVCTEDPVHLLHRSKALGAAAVPVPPAMAFLEESRDFW
jgi:hypothetical protein